MTDPVPESVQGAAEPVVAGEDAPKKRPRARRTRGIIAWVLVVLASLLIPISVISAWAITTVTNTDQYVATMAPLARNQVIIDHLATKATNELFSTHAVQNKVTDLLPPKAKPIVQPVVAQVKSYVHGVALKVFQSEQFGRLFDALNRRTHQTVVDVLSGKQTKLTKLAGNQVVLNLTPQLNQLIDQLNSRGVKLFNPIKPILTNQSGLGLTVVSKSQVSKFSGLFNTLVTLGWAVPVIAIVLGVLGVVVAVQRRKTLLRLAVGIGLFTLLLLGALAWGRTEFLNQASSHRFDVGVAAAVWDTLLRFLKADLRWALLGCVLVALGAWLAGPARYAVWIRTKAAAGGRWVVAQGRAVTSAAGRGVSGSQGAQKTGAWIAEHVKGLRILGVVIAGLFLLLGDNVTGWDLLILVIVLAVYLGLLQVVVYWARRVSRDRAPAAAGAGPTAT
jgi:hypothetical protein